MPIDLLHSDIQEALRETSPLLSSVQLANTITYYGTKYTVGMILSYGSTGGLPDFVEVVQMAILDNCVHFIVKLLAAWEPGCFSGYYGWAKQSIKYKMANYRTKFRGFGVPELQDEFRRITTVHLESKFMSKLDEYTPKLLVLFHSKGEALGLRLQAILLKFQDADGDSVSQDLAVQEMKIYKIKTETSEGTADFGIVVEGVKVLSDLAPVRKLRESSLDMTLEVEMVLRILPPVPPSSPILRKLLGVHSVKPLYALSCMLMGFLCIQ
ncbi:hypothetical protein AOLI_G00241900 [Acnodon oligacanthus]